MSRSKRPSNGRHPLKADNPTALDAGAKERVRETLHTHINTIVNLREARGDSSHLQFAASLFRSALGDDTFQALVKCEDGDRLSQLMTLVKIGGLIAGLAVEQTAGQVWQSDAVAIEKDLLTLVDRQKKDGPPAWLLPRGKERSNPAEAEHHRRAVVWQRFIAAARESSSTGTDEVSSLYGVSARTIMNWIAEVTNNREMAHRLAAAEGFLKAETGERIAAIYEGSFIRIIWMKQRQEHYKRGQSGHYLELLTAQANEYRALVGKRAFNTR